MPISLTIAGVDKTADVTVGSLEVRKTANGRGTLHCRIFSEDGSYRPALDAEVILIEDGVTEFGGNISMTSEEAVADHLQAPIETTIEAMDFNGLAKRRHVNETIAAGTLKAALQGIVPYIPGVTLDPAQIDGPAIGAQVWADVKTEDVLEQLRALSSVDIWEVTSLKQLRMFNPGTVPAPFNIAAGTTVVTGVTVEPTREQYANRVIVRTGSVRAQADDAAQQALYGIWELVVAAPDNTTQANAQALADAILAQSTPILKRLTYRTYEKGLQPRQTQTINLPERNVNNTFLLTEVVIRETAPGQLERVVTATEGLVYRTGWRETYKRWNAAGTTVAGAGGASSGLTRFAYPLAGDGVQGVLSTVPTWVPVSGGPTIGQGAMQVQINTVPRGTTAALIVARLRALDAGVSVKARLYDVTDGVACPGESALVTSTAWQTVSFSVTLTPGSHLYELQLLPGAANAIVFGTGYLE